jgi:hypothetical protein
MILLPAHPHPPLLLSPQQVVTFQTSWVSPAVFRIHDILGWIRIRIRILGSMLLTNGSGSGSCYFRHRPSRCQQKLIFNTVFSAYYFLKVHLHHFSKIKSQKESQNRRNQGFAYYFCMMIKSGSGAGSIPLTSGSGSGRPKNMWIRIRNTGRRSSLLT